MGVHRGAEENHAKSLKFNKHPKFPSDELLTQYQKIPKGFVIMSKLTELNLELGQRWTLVLATDKKFQWGHPFQSLISSRFRKDDWDRNPRSVISMDSNTNSGMLSGQA